MNIPGATAAMIGLVGVSLTLAGCGAPVDTTSQPQATANPITAAPVESHLPLPPAIASVADIRADHNAAVVEALGLLAGAPPTMADEKQMRALIGECALTPTHFLLGRRTTCRRPGAIRILGLRDRDDCDTTWPQSRGTPLVTGTSVYLCFDPTLGDSDGGKGDTYHAESMLISFIPTPGALLRRPGDGIGTPNSDAPPDTSLPPGNTVICSDGSISHAGGRQGACSHHGGVG